MAALLGAWQWHRYRRGKTLLIFSIHCVLCALSSICIVEIATAATPAASGLALHWRVTAGILSRATTVSLLAGLTGFRLRWYHNLIWAIALFVATVNTLLAPLNAQVLEVATLTLPWGEVLSRPVRGPAGWWVLPIYAVMSTVDFYGLWGAQRLSREDRSGGILVALASAGGLFSLVLAFVTDVVRIDVAYLGALPYALWVGPIALLILRDDARRAERLAASEAAARESETRFNTLAEQASDGIFTSSTEGRLLEVNSAGCEMFGRARDELLGAAIASFVEPGEAERVRQELNRLIEHRAAVSEWQLRRKDGTLFYGEVNARMLPDGRLLGVLRDVTERKRAQETIRQILEGLAPTTGRDFFLALANHLSRVCPADYVVVAAIDADNPHRAHTIATSHRGQTDVNLSYPLQHTPCENVVSAGFCHYARGVQQVFPEDRHLSRLGIESYMGIPLRSGSRQQPLGLICLLHSQPLERPEHVETILRVVAARAAAELERELAEAARRKTESLHLAILESSLDGVIVMNAAGEIVEFNSAAETLFGYPRAGVIGKSLAECIIPEDQRAAQRRALQRFLATGEGSLLGRRIEMQALRADGTLVHVELAIAAIPGAKAPLFAGVIRDITARLALEQQLRQSQKMQAIGQLAGGVAHDFNNLLTVIMSCSELLLDPLPTGDPQREVVGAIQNASDRAALLTRQLLMFSRKAVLEPKAIDLNLIIQNIATMLRRVIGENISLTTSLAPALSRIKSDRGQIEQVIMNLSLNARDAMDAGGSLTIETSNTTIDEEYCRIHPQAAPGRFVHLRVADTGCGMTPEVRSHLFEPFYTTKGPGKGTGLGLATVYGIVQQSGGFITVAGEVGCGTTVSIFLPALEREELVEPMKSPSSTAPRAEKSRAATVLLVEDDNAVRRVARIALEMHGYTVLEAANGPDALRLIDGHPEQVHLLVTDVVMPEMSGGMLAEQLRSRHAQVKVLFVSGYNEDALVRQGLFAATDRLLQKPFTSSALAATVQDVLECPAWPAARESST